MKTKVVLCFAAAIWTAAGANDISWSASTGNDNNPCTRQQPCRTAAKAVAATAIGGVVHLADSADYGPVSITYPISIDGIGEGVVLQGNPATPTAVYIAS